MYVSQDHRVEDEDDAFKNIIDSAIPLKEERNVERQLANLDTAELGGGLSSVEFAEKLYEQFIKSGNMADLDAAVALFCKGNAELPEKKAVTLNNLGSVLKARFKHRDGGQQIDLDEAISFYTQALELFPPPHPNRSESLTNLANALETRFEHGGQQNDLDAGSCSNIFS
jgi:tetratricopeptide (TPR) repeat protein